MWEYALAEAVLSTGAALIVSLGLSATSTTSAIAQRSRPNILVIMGDDIGWENLGSYHQGLMLDATPNLDKLASEGMRFTDYYAEAWPLRWGSASILEAC